MYKTIKPIFKINIFLLIVTIIIICSCMTGCKTPEYLNGTIALGYRNNTYYLITSSHETFSLADYDDVKPVFGDYLMVQKKNKWGFIEKSGKQITKIKYDTVNPMEEDKAVVTLNGKTLIIDSKDQVIYTFSDNITSYSSFKDNILVIEKDGLFGYLKYDGHNFTILAEPQYNYAGSYKGGYAVVGMRDANKVLKYSYINENAELMTSSYVFDEAYDFNNSFARVGLKNNDSSSIDINYQYLKFNDSKLTYLSNKSGNIIKNGYATDFMNGLAFTANYQIYNNDESQKYKWFSFVDLVGNQNYDNQIEDYAKKMPRTFLPKSPIFINDCLIFQNGNRNRGTWEILYNSKRYYAEMDNTYYEFKNVTWNIDENDELVKETTANLNYSINLVIQYLSKPIDIGTFKFNGNTNLYIAKSKISGNKCGLITITYTPFEQTDKYCADDFIIVANYIAPAIYDEIIY